MPIGPVGDASELAVEVSGVGVGQGRNAAFAQLRSSSQPRTPRLYECVVPEDGEFRFSDTGPRQPRAIIASWIQRGRRWSTGSVGPAKRFGGRSALTPPPPLPS